MAGVTVIYKGDRITTIDNSGKKTLETAGKYCEDDIIINYNKNGNATKEGNSTITVTDAEEDYVCGLTQYGVCEQNASTNAISCNNGVLSISGGEIITTATNSETLTLGTQTATVENLYSVGNVRDTQEIVSGKIIHKNNICIYDGTQPVGDKYISSTGSKENGAIIIYPLETEYTGTNLASFTETNQGELNSLEVNMAPIQDLHGYDNPWPTGGGVSKCPSLANGTHTMTNGLTVTIQDGEITIDGTASGSGYYEEAIESTVMPADTYVSLNNPAATYNIAYVFLNGNTQIAAPSTAPANATKHTTGLSGATVNKLRVYCKAGTYDNFKMSPILHEGSTPQAWQPYANICPISGRTGANVYVSPTTAQADATTYAVDWTSEAGTVYGGTLDVVSGVLTVNMAFVDLGSLNWTLSAGGANIFTVTLSDRKYSDDIKAMCSMYPFKGTISQSSDAPSKGDKTCCFYYQAGQSYRNFYVYDTAYLDVASFKAAMSGVQLCYELATPVTYELTPQEVVTLVGQNNIFSPDATSIKVAVSNLRIDQVIPQPLTLVEGDNTITATNLSVSAVPLKLEYIANGDNLSYGSNTSNYVNAGAADYMII